MSTGGRTLYPFSAVVGQDRLRLALILCAISPRIGGVVIRGEKGTAKTTTVRAFASLLGDAPLVDLPIGATEDRVVGSLDMETILTTGKAHYNPGLLSQADGGVLYVDEVNLLADHLVDSLLDAAATGQVTVERDGISHSSPANFVLVGTMNPEEGSCVRSFLIVLVWPSMSWPPKMLRFVQRSCGVGSHLNRLHNLLFNHGPMRTHQRRS